MNEHAGREQEIEARVKAAGEAHEKRLRWALAFRQRRGFWPGYSHIAEVRDLLPAESVAWALAQLREARKMPAAVEKLAERIRLCAAEAGSPKQAALLTVLLELDRILKGGD